MVNVLSVNYSMMFPYIKSGHIAGPSSVLVKYSNEEGPVRACISLCTEWKNYRPISTSCKTDGRSHSDYKDIEVNWCKFLNFIQLIMYIKDGIYLLKCNIDLLH